MTNSAAQKRRQILESVLEHVPFDGWTDSAYGRGIKATGMTRGEADLLFPQGLRDLVDLFGTSIDDAMQARITEQPRFARMRVRDKIAFAVRARFEAMAAHRDATRRMLVWYALPLHLSLGAKRLYRTVDLVWRAAGDSATDFNFYTKRLLLAGVVKATTLFWLNDDSPDSRATWDFLDRRLGDVLTLGKGIDLIKNWLPLRRA